MPSRIRERPAVAPIAAFSLFGAAIGLLLVGRFIQFDDTSGFGSDDWRMPFGYLAGLAAIASIVVASAAATARRLLGGVMATLDVLIVWQALANDGFRFIWSGDEGEVFLFVVALGWLAFALVATGRGATPAPAWGHVADGTGLRAVVYAGLTIVIVLIAFSLGTSHFEATECASGDGECDLAGLEGMVWAVGALALCVVASGGCEVYLRIRKRRGVD